MENLPSPGNSCGSPFSDVTSGSPSQYSDAFEPVSPDYNIDTLRAEYSVTSSASYETSAKDLAPKTREIAYGDLADELFYRSLSVGTPDGIQSHCQHVMSKFNSGSMNLPSMSKLLDFTQPKKPSKEGTVKRPMNAFMCFSKVERGHLSAGQPELHNARISRHLGNVWKQCPEVVKNLYKQLAQSVKDLHRQEHPEYKYRPRKRKTSGASTGSSASASSGPAEGTKPAKSARKAAKPRSRARKTSPAHVVPASTLAEVPPASDYHQQLYPDVTHVPDTLHHYPDVKPAKPALSERIPAHPDVQPALPAVPVEAETSATAAASLGEQLPASMKEEPGCGREEARTQGLLDSTILEGQLLPMPLWSLDTLPDLNGEFGFEQSENLVQGFELDEALQVEGELDRWLQTIH